MTRSKIFAVTSKVSTVLGALLSVIYLATQEYAQAILWSGFFLLGLGQWIDQRSANALRKTNWLGTLLQIVGIALMLYGAYRVWKSP